MKENISIPALEIKDIGIIKDVKKGIVKIEGLPSCINGQLLEFSCGLKGMVVGFHKTEVLGLVLGDETRIRTGDAVYGEEGIFNIPVGDGFISRIVNMFASQKTIKARYRKMIFTRYSEMPPVYLT